MNRKRDKKKENKSLLKGGFWNFRIRKNIVEYLNPEHYLNLPWASKNARFIAFCLLLALFYIFNSHHTEQTIRSVHQLEKEINELRGEHVSLETELDNLRRRSQVAQRVEELGLRTPEHAPYEIRIRDEH